MIKSWILLVQVAMGFHSTKQISNYYKNNEGNFAIGVFNRIIGILWFRVVKIRELELRKLLSGYRLTVRYFELLFMSLV